MTYIATRRCSSIPPFQEVFEQVRAEGEFQDSLMTRTGRIFTPAPVEDVSGFACAGNPFCTCQHFGYGCNCGS